MIKQMEKKSLTTEDVLIKMLKTGKKINKFDFLSKTNSIGMATVCLPQRILDLRQKGWIIKSQSVKGKGNLKEYWVERDEIKRHAS